MLTYYVTMVLATGSAALAGLSQQRVEGDLRRPGRGTANAFAVLSGITLTSVAAFRWHVGVDYWQYETNYSDYTRLEWGQLKILGEPGLRVLAKVSLWIRDDPATMFALAALITVGLTVRTLYRHSTAFGLAILLYILTSSWQGSFNGVRQYLACAILFAGHRYVLERRFAPYVLVVALASLFHISALVGLLVYWVPRRRLGLARATALIVVAVVAVSAYSILGDVIDWFKQSDVSTGSYFIQEVNPLRILAALAPLVVYWLFTDKSRLRPADHFCLNMSFINGAVLLAAAGSAYVARFSIYTSIYLALSIPVILRTRDPALSRVLVPVAVVAYFTFWHWETSRVSALNDFKWVFQR